MSLRPTVLAALLSIVAGLGVVLAGPAQAVPDRDCADFANQRQAQIFFLDNGGPGSDPHRLDADDDGKACDSLPCPCYTGGGSTQPPAAPPAKGIRIVKVIDGDTVRVRFPGGRTSSVRLLGINAPEVRNPTQCGSFKSTTSLRGILPVGTRVGLVRDRSQANADRYGRLLRYVSKGKTDVNRMQVRRGWARVYVYNRKPFKRTGSYRTAERAAKHGPVGVWKSC